MTDQDRSSDATGDGDAASPCDRRIKEQPSTMLSNKAGDEQIRDKVSAQLGAELRVTGPDGLHIGGEGLLKMAVSLAGPGYPGDKRLWSASLP